MVFMITAFMTMADFTVTVVQEAASMEEVDSTVVVEVSMEEGAVSMVAEEAAGTGGDRDPENVRT